MELIIADIKKRVAGNTDLSEEDFKELVNLFKERHISIMALENLLNYYQSPRQTGNEVQTAAFVLPCEVMKTSNDVLSQENDRLHHELDLAINAKNELQEKLKNKQIVVKWMTASLILMVIISIVAWMF